MIKIHIHKQIFLNALYLNWKQCYFSAKEWQQIQIITKIHLHKRLFPNVETAKRARLRLLFVTDEGPGKQPSLTFLCKLELNNELYLWRAGGLNAPGVGGSRGPPSLLCSCEKSGLLFPTASQTQNSPSAREGHVTPLIYTYRERRRTYPSCAN